MTKSILPLAIGAGLVLFVLAAAAKKPLPPALAERFDDALRAADAPDVGTNPIANVVARQKLDAAARDLEAAGFPSEAKQLRTRLALLPQVAPPPILGPPRPAGAPPPAAPPATLTTDQAAKLVADALASGDPKTLMATADALAAAGHGDLSGQLRQRAGDLMLGAPVAAPGGPAV